MLTLSKQAESRMTIHAVSEIITRRLPEYGQRAVIRYDNGERYVHVDRQAYVNNIYRMIRYFNERNATRKVIATFVKNRPEWDMIAFASLYTANILFPLDTKMNAEELCHLMGQNPPDYLLVGRAQQERIQALIATLRLNTTVLLADLYTVYEDRGIPPMVAAAENEVRLSDIPANDEATVLPAPATGLQVPDTILAQYATSGTTSLPKIVCITQENIVYQLNEALEMINLRKNEDVLSLGPYTHIATLLEFLVAKTKLFTVTYFTREAEDDGILEAEIKKMKRQNVRIRCLMAVPKFWNYVLKEVLEELSEKAVFRKLYQHLISIEKSDHFYDIGTLDKAKLIAARTLLRNKLGGYFAYGISSSSKIEAGVIDIFAKLGITVIDVYGATEAAGVIAKNALNESKRGYCGKLLRGMDYRLKDVHRVPGIAHPVGALFIRGPGIARGYLSDTVFPHDDEGFYDTGDVAYVDPEGWVFLVGRRKELIRWENGRYSDPMHISNLLVRSLWVKDGLVVRREGEDFLSAFLLPDYPRIEKSARYREGIKNGLEKKQVLRRFLEEAIQYAQSLIGDFPVLSVDKIFLLERRLQRTPTHKIKLVAELKQLNVDNFI